MKNTRLLGIALVLLLAASMAAAQTLTGSIVGKISDDQGGAVPGANLTLTGKTGTKTATTGTDGTYRFAAVDPGAYELSVALSGFRPSKVENIVVSVGKVLEINLSLALAGIAETVTVTGESPVVDVASSATNNQLSQDLIFNMPIRQGRVPGINLMNFAPGINNEAAYGGDSASGNGLFLDGVDTRDPSGGTAWTFYNYNIVEEVQLQGLGAPAEYGSFSGAIVNTITKSGGNRYAGLFDAYYSRGSFASKNVPDDLLKENPSLGLSAKNIALLDVTGQLSGPIVKDKLFFFLSGQRYYKNDDPSGPTSFRKEWSPRLNGKVTWQPTTNDNVLAHIQYDEFNIIGRQGLGVASTDEQTNEEDAPEWYWNGQWRHLFGSKTFTEVKYTGWWGYFDLTPVSDRPVHLDENGLYTGGQGWFYLADRGRHQVNASISHFAEAFGKHDFKFGVEIERSRTRDRYGYVNDTYYYDYGGRPYYGYSYGYDVAGRNHRESLYAQDSWHIGDRLTLNPGVRVDFVRGRHPDVGRVYSATNVGPRVGFAFDITGDQKTVLKGSYSQYYEGIFNDLYKRAAPGYKDKIKWDMTACPSIDPSVRCPQNLRDVISITRPPTGTIDSDTKHPRVDEFSLGIERALTRDLRFSVTGLYRVNKNFVGSVLPLARWTPRTVTTAATTPADRFPVRSITVYNWANRTASQDTLLITNPHGFRFLDPNGNVLGTIDAERNYKALMAVLSKRFRQRWMAQVSYVLSKAEGTIDNTSESLFGGSRFYETPTLALVNSQGRSTNDRTHELKVMLGVQVPKVDVAVNAYWRTLSGRPYTAFQRYLSSSINWFSYYSNSAGRQPLLEPRGSRRRPTENNLDLRLEKIFKIDNDRLALFADITNVTNESTILTFQSRVPSSTVATGPGTTATVPFGAASTLASPRQATIGARWSF